MSITNFISRARNALFGSQAESMTIFRMFQQFKEVLALNNQVLEMMADANDKLSGDYIFDRHYIETLCSDLTGMVEKLVYALDTMEPKKYNRLRESFQMIRESIDADLTGVKQWVSTEFLLNYSEITRTRNDEVGNKNCNLATLGNSLKMRIPKGFAVTTAAFHAFLAYNRLEENIIRQLKSLESGTNTLENTAHSIQERILQGKMPRKLSRDIEKYRESLFGKVDTPLVVRSSAIGEDGTLSFAGQYQSVVNVPVAKLANAYRKVLASLYAPNALAYRAQLQFPETETAMAVGIQEMIDARISGVMYTRDPIDPEKETMQVHATWGLGAPIVSGTITSDCFVVKRDAPHEMVDFTVVRKAKQLNPSASGTTSSNPVDEWDQTTPCLNPDQLQILASAAMQIETYFKNPQDIEFAFTKNDELVILQVRPLKVQPPSKKARSVSLSDLSKRYPVLLDGAGDIAQKGVGIGPVYTVKSEKDLNSFPTGAILVAEYASPLYAQVLMKAAGIITEVGSVAGHLATVAREYSLPALFNCQGASKILTNETIITMDAEEKMVYQGRISELQYYNLTEENIEETSEYRLLRRILRKIEPLNLVDPSEKNFVPEACRTLHDVTRFVHEKAVDALIDFNYQNSNTAGREVVQLSWEIPMDLVLIDIGGGLVAHGNDRKVLPEQVLSQPMQAIMQGLAHPGAWDSKPMPVDFSSFMSSLTRTMAPEVTTPKHMGRNLAVISKEYANISLRLGYHFTMIDAYYSDVINDNYIYFRFFGGVTDDQRRARRARFLGEVLASLDFRIELHGDLVVARAKKLDAERIHSRLVALGLLIGFTRQLDVRMISEERISENIELFTTLMEECHE